MSNNLALFLEDLLPLRSVVVTLEFLQPVTLDFFHQPRVTALLKSLLIECEVYDQLIVIDTPESGRVSYQRGDQYRFNLIALDGADEVLTELLAKLKGLPESAPVKDIKVPFRNNLRLLALQDAFSCDMIQSVEQMSLYGPQQLTEEALVWQSRCEQLHWRWLSPVRLLQDKSARGTAKGEARYCHDASHISADLLLNRLHDSFADLIRRRSGRQEDKRDKPPSISLDSCHLFWIDSQYQNGTSSQPMGGASGLIHFSDLGELSTAWWRLLVLGQYVGMGQRRAFGWGRYQLTSDIGEFSFRRVLPAHPL